MNESMILEMLPLGDFQANAFLVRHQEDPSACWIVDCGPGPGPLMERMEQLGVRPAGIVLTHCHHDHIGGIDAVLSRYGSMPIAAHMEEWQWNSEPELNLSAFLGQPSTATPADIELADGGYCPLGAGWSILHVPGHSPGSVAFHHPETRTLIAGDTLFAGSIGRVDFPTSDPQAMKRSLSRLMGLSDETQIFPGHGLPTTIGDERAKNPFLRDGIPSF